MVVLDHSNNFINLLKLEESAAILLLSQQRHTKDFDAKDKKKIIKRLGYYLLAII